MNGKQGVIFDMDGVLVDSYQAHFESWKTIAAEEGRVIRVEEFATTFGCTTREIITMLWGPNRFDAMQITQLDDRKEAAFRKILDANFLVMEGANTLIASLHDAGFALAVGSSGPPDNVKMVLDRLDPQSRFSAVVTGMDVSRGKPDPQVFLIAAEQLGLSPSDCTVIEDAPLGVEAAQRAGMIAIGFASTGRTREELDSADLVIDSLTELSAELIAKRAFLSKP